MDKTTLGLIAALTAAAPLASAQASTPLVDAQRALHATSIAELLDPIPNALDVMKTAEASQPAAADKTEVAQLYHHHHHHHHNFIRRLFHHHHHHHHHHYHHHHHHHHDMM